MSNSFAPDVAAAVSAIEELPRAYAALSDDELLKVTRLDAALSRAAAARVALGAGEIARRSTREQGHSGLAQRNGFRSPVDLVQATMGSTGRDASTAVRVGSLDPSSPVAAALGDGLSVAGADAITRGLGEPAGSITAEILADAASALLADTPGLDADRLFRRARDARDDLDLAGVPDREALLVSKRSLRFVKQSDGMSRLVWVMDPETAAQVGDLFDRATSPKLGGPRFVSGDRAELAAKIEQDPRSVNQLASDVFLNLLRVGADADSSHLLGTGAPIVRVIVAKKDLDAGAAGIAFIEGQSAPVSIATVERTMCFGGVGQAIFDDNLQPLDLGHAQRLFSSKQKAALALRDGGCMFEDCPCPPSWTEAHHLIEWKKGGKTDILNAILLCKFHHLMLHNNGWEIRYRDNKLWLIPPPTIDPTQTPRLLRSKSRAAKRAG